MMLQTLFSTIWDNVATTLLVESCAVCTCNNNNNINNNNKNICGRKKQGVTKFLWEKTKPREEKSDLWFHNVLIFWNVFMCKSHKLEKCRFEKHVTVLKHMWQIEWAGACFQLRTNGLRSEISHNGITSYACKGSEISICCLYDIYIKGLSLSALLRGCLCAYIPKLFNALIFL